VTTPADGAPERPDHPEPPDQPGVASREDQGFQRVHPISPLLRVGVFIVAGALATWQQVVQDAEWGAVLLSLVGFVVVGLVYGGLSWWFTRFRIDSDELRIDSGVLLRRSRRISIERLQAVDVVQPLLARLFAMAELRFEVAGGSRTEAPLAYLRLDEAYRLRSVLLDRDLPAATADRTTPPTDSSAVAPHEMPAAAQTDPRQEWEIARVDPAWLVVGTLLSGEFIGSLVFAVLATVASAVAGEVAGLALVLPALFGAGSVLMRGIVQQWGFVLTDTGRGWRLRSGLFDLRTQTVPLDRVQGIALVEPLLWRRLGWVKVQVDVAGYAGTSASSGSPGRYTTSTLLPVAPRPLALAVLARLVPGGPATEVPQRPAPRRARFFRPIGWRYLGVGATADVVVTTQGWVRRRTDIVPYAKIQSIRVRQGPLQRRLGLLDVRVQTTPGPVDALARHRLEQELHELVVPPLERGASARVASGRPAPGG
jgi:putative membrane protein